MNKQGRKGRHNSLLSGARVYLSGPMDFVASRQEEMKNGWRTRVGDFLRAMGCVVFDPWRKPNVRGLQEYGRETSASTGARRAWTFKDSSQGAEARSKLTGKYWETLHIDLRMVDTSDFIVAYCPTNIYSVGTPHEIALARQQRKPVLFVSPPVEFPALDALSKHLARDKAGKKLLKDLKREVPIKVNPGGIPSLWYMPLLGGESFFDGFGFERFRRRFRWREHPLDLREVKRKPMRPLLPFLETLASKLPEKWDAKRHTYVRNDDWLLWDLHQYGKGVEVNWSRKAER